MENTKPFLLIINGPSGVGKSTLAKKIHSDYKMSYLLDIDKIKSNFSHFRDNNAVSVSESVSLSHAMTEHLLSKGFPVIIDRMLWNEYSRSVEMFEEIANKLNAYFIHIDLSADLETVLSRADARGYPKENEGGLNREKVITFHEKTKNSLAQYSVGHTIDTTTLSEEEVYEKATQILIKAIES